MSDSILVVEDELGLQEALAYSLRQAGYEVSTAGDGRSGLDLARRLKPDLIILDVMLPEMDGLEVTRQIRRELNPAILMLTARSDEVDRVVGLEVGADDYMVKPFSMRELMARVKAMLRRTQLLRQEIAEPAAGEHRRITFDNLSIDVTRREASIAGRALALKPKEYDLLLFLAEHKGRLLSREFILEKVWGWDYIGDSRTVDVHVRWLREKLEVDASKPTRIVTVRGAGYRFEG